MSDLYSDQDKIYAPSPRSASIIPSDTNAIDVPKALYIGTGGTLIMRGIADTADTTWKNLANGTILPFRAQYIRATGTTAADIVAMY